MFQKLIHRLANSNIVIPTVLFEQSRQTVLFETLSKICCLNALFERTLSNRV